MSKMTVPRVSGNSTTDTPTIAMNIGDFLLEVTSNTEVGDKQLQKVAKEIRKRHNAYDGMLMELQETLKDMKGWDGTPEAYEIMQVNIADRIKKAKRGSNN